MPDPQGGQGGLAAQPQPSATLEHDPPRRDVVAEGSRRGNPCQLAAVRALPLSFSRGVTVLVGENGSGKSTLVEAIAVAAGFNAEGGNGNADFETAATTRR